GYVARLCEGCDTPIPEGRSTKRYCSERCSKNARRKRAAATCPGNCRRPGYVVPEAAGDSYADTANVGRVASIGVEAEISAPLVQETHISARGNAADEPPPLMARYRVVLGHPFIVIESTAHLTASPTSQVSTRALHAHPGADTTLPPVISNPNMERAAA